MSARALRVGIVLGDNLVEERLFVGATPVTFGQALRCQLSVPIDRLPHAHVLFTQIEGHWAVHPAPGMTGRVAQRGQLDDELRGEVPLAPGARGRLALGEATILFQELAAPAPSPRPQLPASLRGTLGDRIDRRLAAIVGASLALHVGIAAWAWAAEIEEPLVSSTPLARYHHETHAISIPADVAATPVAQSGAATPAAPARQTPAPIVTPSRVAPAPPRAATVDDAQRFAQLLTTNDERPGGRTEIRNRLPGSELGQQIREIRDNDRTIGNDDAGFRERAREGIGDGTRPIVDDAPSRIVEQRPREEQPATTGRIVLRPDRPPPGNPPTPELVLAKIRSQYMPGLMRCYKRGLVDDASLSGRVAVAFTVTDTGKVADASARGLTPQIDACIAAQMATWRFPVAKDKDGDAIDLDIALTLALVPSP